MILHTYWRSSAAYRVRIALALKGLTCQSAFVHLARDGGEQLSDAYAALNPQRLIPALDLGEGRVLTQSLAIIEYLDETSPDPPLLPADPLGRARVRALAQAIACDIHPLNNLRVLKYLADDRTTGIGDAGRADWYRHWIHTGFKALELALAGSTQTGGFCHGETPGLADICLTPQVYNARRFEISLTPYPCIRRIDAACREIDAFAAAAPQAQDDAH